MGAIVISVTVMAFIVGYEPEKKLDFTEPVFTKEGTYACNEPEQLRDITTSAMKRMDRFGGTFESCSAFSPQRVVILQHSENGRIVKIAPVGLTPEWTATVAGWVFVGDLRN